MMSKVEVVSSVAEGNRPPSARPAIALALVLIALTLRLVVDLRPLGEALDVEPEIRSRPAYLKPTPATSHATAHAQHQHPHAFAIQVCCTVGCAHAR